MKFFSPDELPAKARLYILLVIGLGLPVALYSLIQVIFFSEPTWLFLACLTAVGAFFPVRIRYAGDKILSLGITVADVFLFSAILFFSPEVAVVIGLIDGVIASSQILHKKRIYRFFFNLSQMSLVTFLVAELFYRLQGQAPPMDPGQIASVPYLLVSLALCAFIYFVLNSTAVAVAISMSSNRPLRELWAQNFAWAAVSHLAGASAAAVIFFLLERTLLFAVGITIPLILIIYHSYKMTNQRIRLLLDSKQFLQGSLDALSSYITVLTDSGHLIAVNEAWQEVILRDGLFGPDHEVGSNYLHSLHTRFATDEDAVRLATGIRAVISGDEDQYELEYQSTSSGSWFVVRVTRFKGEGPVRVVVAHEDITERKLAEQKLRESEERYRQFFEDDLTADFIATPDGSLTKCNRAFARIFGFGSVDEAVKANLFSLFRHSPTAASFQQDLRLHQKFEYREMQLWPLNGEEVHVVANVTGEFGADGELEVFRGYLFDDTRRKKLEEELRQSQKMEAVGQLAGGIAHDFNNILTVITGYGEFLRRAVREDEELKRDADMIMEAAHRASRLTAQLLAFSRRQVLQLEVLSLNRVVAEMNNLLQRVIGEDIELVTILDPDLGTSKVDPGQIEQVIMNLAVNARDAMPQGGRIAIETANVEVADMGEADPPEIQPGTYVCLTVRDAGLGMTNEVKSRIFEPFFTTKEKGQGTGLGLSTVYGIVKQSGGHILVASQPGAGSSFTIYFPRIQDPSTQRKRLSPYEAAPGGSETILLVEDEDRIRELIREILSRKGYEVIEAAHGGQAIPISDQKQGPIHLLLTDVVMPEMGGWELAEALREANRRPGLKVLYMSGYPESQRIRRADPVQMSKSFLAKPFTPDTLLMKVREVLDTKIGSER